MEFYPSAAAAQQAGYRACKRCRPDASPGTPAWNERADATARAMRLISDGVVDRDGVPGLARRLGYSVRQVERLLHTELGAGPLALARAARAQTGRTLIESTSMRMHEIAYSAGFSSLRSFNDCIAQVYGTTPTALRGRTHAGGDRGTVSLRLPYREPFHPDSLFGHLVATAVPGVEEWSEGAYRTTVDLPHGPGIVSLRPAAGHIACTAHLADMRDLSAAVNRCRWLLDLDADPVLVDSQLARDPVLGTLVRSHPGARVPRIIDGPQFAIRAVLGQQISTAAARTHAGRLVRSLGKPLDHPDGTLTHLFPTPEALLDADPSSLAMPESRRRTLFAVAGALANGTLDLRLGADWSGARTALDELPGIGPWTRESILMRALGDPDAFIATDLGVKTSARALGLPGTPGALTKHAEAWRPWRAYAVQYLWAAGDHAVGRMPE
ncbi:AlkA N-terminal domain-containing protein [Spelaeicoccus albus]